MNGNEREGNGRDDIATLVRIAGRRQAVPSERTDRVRTAARDTWREQLRHRSRRRYTWAAASLAAAAMLVAALLLVGRSGLIGTAADGPLMRAESLQGSVRLRTDGDTGPGRALRPGDEVGLGAEIETAATGRAAFRLASGHSVRLDNGTTVRLHEAQVLDLAGGAIYVDSAGARPEDVVTVETALGTVREIGTRFETRMTRESLRVRMREGAVVVSGNGRSITAEAGTELELDTNGMVHRRAVASFGEAWSWVADIGPRREFNGRSAREFLDWVTREHGWTLAFSDEATARSADEIVLGGTTAGLALDEALEAVLPTCRLTHRVDRGVLLVSPLAEE